MSTNEIRGSAKGAPRPPTAEHSGMAVSLSMFQRSHIAYSGAFCDRGMNGEAWDVEGAETGAVMEAYMCTATVKL